MSKSYRILQKNGHIPRTLLETLMMIAEMVGYAEEIHAPLYRYDLHRPHLVFRVCIDND